MKTSFWLGAFSIAAVAALAWLTHQPETARATVPAAAEVPLVVPATTGSSDFLYTDAGFHEAEAGLSPSARAGREIWFKATAGNARFHTYTFQQRITALIDWYGVLRGDARDTRFKTWGLINDPGCCTPGSTGCPAKSAEETYGFDWCPGDETLLKFVGKPGYRDPACDFKDASVAASDPDGHQKVARIAATWLSVPPPARSASESFPIRASTRRCGSRSTAALAVGKATTANCPATPRVPTSRYANWPMPRSNRRS